MVLALETGARFNTIRILQWKNINFGTRCLQFGKDKTTAGNYSQKSFSLAAYKGQTIRLQFRCTTDFSITTTFRVDDVSLE